MSLVEVARIYIEVYGNPVTAARLLDRAVDAAEALELADLAAEASNLRQTLR
jgi:hypothetical protein